MNKIKIFADSTSDVPAHWRQQYEISIVPLYTVFGDEALQDGVNIHPEQLFQRKPRGTFTAYRRTFSVGFYSSLCALHRTRGRHFIYQSVFRAIIYVPECATRCL